MALANRPAAPSAGASRPSRAISIARVPPRTSKRPARRRTTAASAAARGGGGDDDDAGSTAAAAPLLATNKAKQQQHTTWGYYSPPATGDDDNGLAWTFDDDTGAPGRGSDSRLPQLAAAAPPSSPSAALAATTKTPGRPKPNQADQEEDPLVVLTRLPEQLSDPRALTRGVLLVDKPAGWTAGDVVRAVRWALGGGSKRGGGGGSRSLSVAHAGALDRHATGLMVLCLGSESAALLSPRCASLERVYTGTITLGVETATWDAWARDEGRGARAAGGVAAAMAAAAGAAASSSPSSSSSKSSSPLPPPPTAEVVDTMPWDHVMDEAIAAAAAALRGGGGGGAAAPAAAAAATPANAPPAALDGGGGDRGLLLPPAPRSGGKRAGRSAAWYEERGAAPPIPLPARRVPVRELAVWREAGPVLGFRLAAGPGASPRALAHALGEALGTCAHLSSLRREALGALSVERAWPLDALLPALQSGRGGALRTAARRRQTGRW